MDEPPQETKGSWKPRVLLNFLWTLSVAQFAVAATFLVVDSRSEFIARQYEDGNGESSTVVDFLLRESKSILQSVLLPTLPLVAAMSALSVVVYFVVKRDLRNLDSLKLRIALGWLLVLVPSCVSVDGLYLLAPMWAIAVVPASIDQLHGLRWRIAELVAFGLLSGLAIYFPLV